jgi:hypothetical protein
LWGFFILVDLTIPLKRKKENPQSFLSFRVNVPRQKVAEPASWH